MMKRITLLLFVTFVLLGVGYGMQPNPIEIMYNGQQLVGQKIIEGTLNLYTVKVYNIDVELENGGKKGKFRLRYFLDCGEKLEEVTVNNYREIVKKYMPNAPDLHKRLGRTGFRFKNLYYMVRFYNHFRSSLEHGPVETACK